MAARRPDQLTELDPILDSAATANPWHDSAAGLPKYQPDWSLLERLLSVPVSAARASESGVFAKAVDAWVANELRRSGFGEDEVWPRKVRPRILPHDIATLLEHLPRPLAEQVRERLSDMPSVAPGDARVLGRAYRKQVDVCIARWDRGPELIVSTKAMVSSFANNVGNRFEEAYGDAFNLRGRFPLAAVGYLLVLRDTILASPDVYERAVDMIRKLRSDGGSDGYTATALVVVSWGNAGQESGAFGPSATNAVKIVDNAVPADISGAQFFSSMIDCVLRNTPIQYHVEARSLKAHRSIPVPEASDG